jgi:hypothetical protein
MHKAGYLYTRLWLGCGGRLNGIKKANVQNGARR